MSLDLTVKGGDAAAMFDLPASVFDSSVALVPAAHAGCGACDTICTLPDGTWVSCRIVDGGGGGGSSGGRGTDTGARCSCSCSSCCAT
jgi:hypothetical protein